MYKDSRLLSRAFEVAEQARRGMYLRDNCDPSSEGSYIQDFRDSNIPDWTPVEFFSDMPHSAGRGIAKSSSSHAVDAWEVRRADEFLSLNEEGKKKVRRQVEDCLRKTKDDELLFVIARYMGSF